MNKQATEDHKTDKLLITLEEARQRYSRGRNNMSKDLEAAHAAVRIGGRVLVAVEKMDKYYLDMIG